MTDQNKKLIWDLPVRIFHWSLVILIPYSWYSIEITNDLENHFLSGFCVLALVIFRIIWGFAGPKYARFSSFIYSPRNIIAYAKTLFTKQRSDHAGHNPLGGLSVMVLLLLLATQVGTGLFATDGDYFFGPLNDYIPWDTSIILTDIHVININILLGFIGLHIVSVLFYLFFKKENLITAMVTGRKIDKKNSIEAIKNSKLIIAIILIFFIAAGVYSLVEYA